MLISPSLLCSKGQLLGQLSVLSMQLSPGETLDTQVSFPSCQYSVLLHVIAGDSSLSMRPPGRLRAQCLGVSWTLRGASCISSLGWR